MNLILLDEEKLAAQLKAEQTPEQRLQNQLDDELMTFGATPTANNNQGKTDCWQREHYRKFFQNVDGRVAPVINGVELAFVGE